MKQRAEVSTEKKKKNIKALFFPVKLPDPFPAAVLEGVNKHIKSIVLKGMTLISVTEPFGNNIKISTNGCLLMI